MKSNKILLKSIKNIIMDNIKNIMILEHMQIEAAERHDIKNLKNLIHTVNLIIPCNEHVPDRTKATLKAFIYRRDKIKGVKKNVCKRFKVHVNVS